MVVKLTDQTYVTVILALKHVKIALRANCVIYQYSITSGTTRLQNCTNDSPRF